MKVYILIHSYFYDLKKEKSDTRVLGVYEDKKGLKKKIEEFRKIKGFSSHISTFYIREYIIDCIPSWKEDYYEYEWGERFE